VEYENLEETSVIACYMIIEMQRWSGGTLEIQL